MNSPRLIRLVALLLCSAGLACRAHVAPPSSAPSPPAVVDPAAAKAWDDFWFARKVSPSPPRTFMDCPPAPFELVNLTKGLISDDEVRSWVMADIRRNAGDAWAANHLRSDVVNAGVFGPPGLNGTDRMIAREQARGAVEIRCKPSRLVAAGVVYLTEYEQHRVPWADLTDYVIVQMFEAKGEPCTRVFPNGSSEPIPAWRRPGELTWQLDTGEFRNDPAVGPIWYQAHGWSCHNDGRGELDEICALVHPKVVPTVTADR